MLLLTYRMPVVFLLQASSPVWVSNLTAKLTSAPRRVSEKKSYHGKATTCIEQNMQVVLKTIMRGACPSDRITEGTVAMLYEQ